MEFGRHRPADILTFLRQELPNAGPDDKQRRQSQRLICRWAVTFEASGSKKYSGVVRDISRRGVLMLTRDPLSLWSELRIWIQLDDNLPPLEAHGVVRRCNKVYGEDWWEVASPLLEVSPDDRRRLEAVIEARLKEQ
ncbi:MAG: PilZ domain-containing protein [Candidatus Xenobia bacterium]